MEITDHDARTLLATSKARNVRNSDGNLYTSLVKALASVTDLTVLNETTPGLSWAGDGGDLNAILIQDETIVLARVGPDLMRAARYASPVGTVEAAKIEDMPNWGPLDFVVKEWCVTLVDGTVFTLRAGSDGSHASQLDDFVREYLLP